MLCELEIWVLELLMRFAQPRFANFFTRNYLETSYCSASQIKNSKASIEGTRILLCGQGRNSF